MVQTKAADFSFEFLNYEGFRKLLRDAPYDSQEATWVASRRALAAFRRDWLRIVPVAIKGRGFVSPGLEARRAKSIGQGFRWQVDPGTQQAARSRHAKVGGRIGTSSFAAHGLEVGGTVRARKGQYMAIPILKAGQENTGAGGLVKPTWKSLAKIMHEMRARWRLKFVRGSSHTIVYAGRRPRKLKSGKYKYNEKVNYGWFPAFILLREVHYRPDRLRFFSTWRSFLPQVQKRFHEEVDLRLRRIAARSKGAR